MGWYGPRSSTTGRRGSRPGRARSRAPRRGGRTRRRPRWRSGSTARPARFGRRTGTAAAGEAERLRPRGPPRSGSLRRRAGRRGGRSRSPPRPPPCPPSTRAWSGTSPTTRASARSSGAELVPDHLASYRLRRVVAGQSLEEAAAAAAESGDRGLFDLRYGVVGDGRSRREHRPGEHGGQRQVAAVRHRGDPSTAAVWTVPPSKVQVAPAGRTI